MDKFMGNLMGLFQAITNHLETQDKAIEELFKNQKEIMKKITNLERVE